MVINIEDSLLQAQSIEPQYVKEQIALLLYEKKILTLFQAAQMAELDKWDFLVLMKQNQVPISYDATDLAHDMSVLDTIFPNKTSI